MYYLTMARLPRSKKQRITRLPPTKAKRGYGFWTCLLFLDTYDELHDPATKTQRNYIFMDQFAAGIQEWENGSRNFYHITWGISPIQPKPGGIFINE